MLICLRSISDSSGPSNASPKHRKGPGIRYKKAPWRHSLEGNSESEFNPVFLRLAPRKPSTQNPRNSTQNPVYKVDLHSTLHPVPVATRRPDSNQIHYEQVPPFI